MNGEPWSPINEKGQRALAEKQERLAAEQDKPARWRTGHHVEINVWEGDNPGRPICQCHTVEDARRIVRAVNGQIEADEIARKSRKALK